MFIYLLNLALNKPTLLISFVSEIVSAENSLNSAGLLFPPYNTIMNTSLILGTTIRPNIGHNR